jgi:hypothetical protein
MSIFAANAQAQMPPPWYNADQMDITTATNYASDTVWPAFTTADAAYYVMLDVVANIDAGDYDGLVDSATQDEFLAYFDSFNTSFDNASAAGGDGNTDVSSANTYLTLALAAYNTGYGNVAIAASASADAAALLALSDYEDSYADYQDAMTYFYEAMALYSW